MLEIKNLVKSFDGRKIIDDLKLTINDGKILTIVGPSGAGKTTLLRCLAGLETIDSGELIMDGVLLILLKWLMQIKLWVWYFRIFNYFRTCRF